MALTFNYVKENKYNDVMEDILTREGYEIEEVDMEGTAYTKCYEPTYALDNFFDDNTEIDIDEVATYEFRPFLAYGFGFSKNVLVIFYDDNGKEIDDLMINIENFIDLFN
jgi:hypothetical protein